MTTSTPYMEYQKHCEELVIFAIKRSSMFYRELKELEWYFKGHEWAYQQFQGLENEKGFNNCFNNWLQNTTSLSLEAGWGIVIPRSALDKNVDFKEMFAELVTNFLSVWINNPS